ncbi:MAG: DUF4369 domain-containing protein [Flavobacterium sp.]
MKKILLFPIVLLVLIGCGKKKAENNLHLTGNIKGLKKGTLYIQRFENAALKAIDTIEIDGDSHFETDIILKSPEMLYLFLDRGVTNSIDNNLPFFAEAGEMNIETQLDSYFAKATITGSQNQKLYEQYQKGNKVFNEKLLVLATERFTALKNKNQAELIRIENVEQSILKRKYLYTVNFALNNAKYDVSPFVVLSEISDINEKYLDTIQKSLSPKVKESFYGKKFMDLHNSLK